MNKGQQKIAVCFDNRGKTCLMISATGNCMGLQDTKFKDSKCPFYKDKSAMTPDEIEFYENKKWQENYQGASKEEVSRLIGIGEKIEETIDFNIPMREAFGL